jgi:hypothetical protein
VNIGYRPSAIGYRPKAKATALDWPMADSRFIPFTESGENNYFLANSPSWIKSCDPSDEIISGESR